MGWVVMCGDRHYQKISKMCVNITSTTHLPTNPYPLPPSSRYFLPDGGVFDEGWCRPQNDGPGLRAISLMIYADALGGPASDEVNSLLWTGDDANQHGGTCRRWWWWWCWKKEVVMGGLTELELTHEQMNK
jgi:hypothetical protein